MRLYCHYRSGKIAVMAIVKASTRAAYKLHIFKNIAKIVHQALALALMYFVVSK